MEINVGPGPSTTTPATYPAPALQFPRSEQIPTSHSPHAFLPQVPPALAPSNLGPSSTPAGGSLAQTTAVSQLARVIRCQTEGTFDSGSPHNHVVGLPSDVGLSSALDGGLPPGTISPELVAQHSKSLAAAADQATLLSVIITMSDVEAASEFILMNPPDPLHEHLHSFVGGILATEASALGVPPPAVHRASLDDFSHLCVPLLTALVV